MIAISSSSRRAWRRAQQRVHRFTGGEARRFTLWRLRQRAATPTMPTFCAQLDYTGRFWEPPPAMPQAGHLAAIGLKRWFSASATMWR